MLDNGFNGGFNISGEDTSSLDREVFINDGETANTEGVPE